MSFACPSLKEVQCHVLDELAVIVGLGLDPPRCTVGRCCGRAGGCVPYQV